MSYAGPAVRIFIAYRRDDSQGFAGRIHDRLVARFGADSVFRDINDIEPGRPWEEAIDDALGSSDVFVLLIGREWLDATDEEGQRRLDDPADRHRREIETAIGRRVRTFVALMEEAEMPRRKHLPQDSEALLTVPALHAIRIADHAFDYGMGELIKSIERAAGREQKEHLDDIPVRREEEEREAEKEPPPDDEERKRRLRMLGAVALGVVLVGGALLLLSSGDDGAGEDGAGTAEVFGEPVEVGGKPVELASDGRGGIWVTDRAGDQVSLIEATDDGQELGGQFPTGPDPEGVAVGAGSVWVANGGDGTVSRLDPETGTVLRDYAVGGEPGGIAISNDAVWVADNGGTSVSRIDLATDEPESIPVGAQPYGIAVGDADVWVTNRASPSVSRIDRESREQVDQIDVGQNPKGIDVSGDAVWVANTGSANVTRIEGETTEAHEVGPEPRGVVVAFGAVWVSLGAEDRVVRLDPDSGEVQQSIEVGDDPEGITAGRDSVWVANGGSGTVTRIRP